MKIFGLMCIMTAILALNPTMGAAQDFAAEPTICGSRCIDCGWNSWEGIVDASHKGPWTQTCDWNPLLKYCTSCESAGGVASDFISAMTIASTIEALRTDHLSAIFTAYSDRIWVNPKRYQVIITGTLCNKNAHGAILNVERETWARLRGLGASFWDPTEK